LLEPNRSQMAVVYSASSSQDSYNNLTGALTVIDRDPTLSPWPDAPARVR